MRFVYRSGKEVSTIDAVLLMASVSDSTPVNVRTTYRNFHEKVQMFHDPMGFMLYFYAQTQRPDVERVEVTETKLLEEAKRVN